MARRTYSAETKAKALAMYPEHGAGETSRVLGVPKPTVISWAQRAGVRSDAAETTRIATEHATAARDAKRAVLVDLLIDKANDLIGRMDQAHEQFMAVGGKDGGIERVEYERATSADVRNYAVAAAVLIDKFRLELGEATARTETVNVEDARELLAAQVDELSKRRALKSA